MYFVTIDSGWCHQSSQNLKTTTSRHISLNIRSQVTSDMSKCNKKVTGTSNVTPFMIQPKFAWRANQRLKYVQEQHAWFSPKCAQNAYKNLQQRQEAPRWSKYAHFVPKHIPTTQSFMTIQPKMCSECQPASPTGPRSNWKLKIDSFSSKTPPSNLIIHDDSAQNVLRVRSSISNRAKDGSLSTFSTKSCMIQLLGVVVERNEPILTILVLLSL